jgi:hypothetical protein
VHRSSAPLQSAGAQDRQAVMRKFCAVPFPRTAQHAIPLNAFFEPTPFVISQFPIRK